jgi:hypothetical protein
VAFGGGLRHDPGMPCQAVRSSARCLASAAWLLSLSGLGSGLVLGLGACGDDSGAGNPFATSGPTTTTNPTTEGATSAPGTSTSDGTTTVGLDDTGTSAATDGIKLDVSVPDVTAGKQDYCNFVDILFVIDNSLSMGDYQAQLAIQWTTFVDEMWNNLPEGTDLHVGMTTTSFYDGSCSEFVSNCVTTASDQTILDHYITPDAGNTGVNGEQGRLFEWNGQRYFEAIVGEDNGALKTWFSQAAVAAGEDGCSFEMMSAAAGYAFHPANAVPNEGFLRDEGAVLVIVILTDEPDKSPEGAATYHQMIVDAKAGCGGADCVVITGITDQCIEGVNNTLWQFFNLFPNFTPDGDIEQPADYSSVVGTALAQVIGETCDQIPPAG